jgi:hypothetical protein
MDPHFCRLLPMPRFSCIIGEVGLLIFHPATNGIPIAPPSSTTGKSIVT